MANSEDLVGTIDDFYVHFDFTEAPSIEQMETVKVMYLFIDAAAAAHRSEAVISIDEPQLHDANAYNKVDGILLSWIYNVHGGIVKKALKALEAIGSVIEDDRLKFVRNTMTKRLTTYAMYGNVMQVVFIEKDANIAGLFHSNGKFKHQVELEQLYGGVSLKSLRFSHKGSSLFVSSLGRQTFAELGIQDKDEIVVHNTRVSNNSNKENEVNYPVQLHKGKTEKKKKQSKKVKKQQIQRVEPVMTMEDYKAQHSLAFTKVLEELQPRLKEIRMGLNALDLQCQPKKMKNTAIKKNMIQEAVGHTLPGSEIGGKAGKSHFVIQVGEVQNLYKTTKASTLSNHQRQSSIPTLDLHGCAKEEAIVLLNESLEVWVDIAMKGSYPFVITAVIVCGCGSQVLSETVQEWIKSTSRVRNAPKNHYV